MKVPSSSLTDNGLSAIILNSEFSGSDMERRRLDIKSTGSISSARPKLSVTSLLSGLIEDNKRNLKLVQNNHCNDSWFSQCYFGVSFKMAGCFPTGTSLKTPWLKNFWSLSLNWFKSEAVSPKPLINGIPTVWVIG